MPRHGAHRGLVRGRHRPAEQRGDLSDQPVQVRFEIRVTGRARRGHRGYFLSGAGVGCDGGGGGMGRFG
ncbi:hypothetical protein ACIHCQ_35780 [Streptomyces sp. NPDC052236]|uniref:hypothetical protein n=1 Tax=Streptomyces sp. NPDC052236 TaxID=3365686 RepID=UPI0037D78E52